MIQSAYERQLVIHPGAHPSCYLQSLFGTTHLHGELHLYWDMHELDIVKALDQLFSCRMKRAEVPMGSSFFLKDVLVSVEGHESTQVSDKLGTYAHKRVQTSSRGLVSHNLSQTCLSSRMSRQSFTC